MREGQGRRSSAGLGAFGGSVQALAPRSALGLALCSAPISTIRSGLTLVLSSTLRSALILTLGLGVGCALQNPTEPSQIRVAFEAPSGEAPETTERRQLPPSGAWWTRAAACPDGAAVVQLAPSAEVGMAEGYGCQLPSGVAHGDYTAWRAGGVLLEHGSYERGAKERLWLSYATGGEISARENFHADELSGRVQRYAAGVLILDATYVAGRREGPLLAYHGNGKLAERASYVADEPHGLFESWDEAGEVSAHGSYVAGVQQGAWTICEADQCTSAHFDAGAQSGLWEVRDRAGVTQRTEDYTVPDQLTRIDYCQGHPCKRTVFVRR